MEHIECCGESAGITTWSQEKDAGRITAVGERDDLSDLLPL